MTSLSKLIQVASDGIRPPVKSVAHLEELSGLGDVQSLLPLLSQKNGFYAFEGALHAYADVETPREHGLLSWNESTLWRSQYAGMADSGIFFAQDVFGHQFGLDDSGVFSFESETGERELVAESIEGWAKLLLSDYPFWTGHPVAHAWQQVNGRLRSGWRLVPKIPFVLGGEISASNVFAAEAVKAMHFYANLAVQIRDLPDGAAVDLKVID
jgi:hypothetical protein